MRIAVLLVNLGGPRTLREVWPFLFHFFRDPAIFRVSSSVRVFLAFLVASLRWRKARKIYASLGGGSPLVNETTALGQRIEEKLNATGKDLWRVFVGMRHGAPRLDDAWTACEAFQPDRRVLLPLFPQFSTTTTGSVLKAVENLASGEKVCVLSSFYELPALINGYAEDIQNWRRGLKPHEKFVILFSAHGLPESVVRAGDPYYEQCLAMAADLRRRASLSDETGILCFQSRFGFQKWLGPSLPDMIRQAGAQQKAVFVVPLSFVTENSETLVELHQEAKKLACRQGVPRFDVCSTPSTNAAFVAGLAEKIENETKIQ
jgi:ferrochelatase